MAQHRIPGDDTPGLLEAYLAAVYRVDVGGTWLALWVGQPAPAALDAARPVCPGNEAAWTLVTAWNPQSRPQDPAANAAADAALRAELDARGLARLRAIGGSPDGCWEEQGWLVAGLDAAAADALARRHDQAGLLHWRAGEPVRLRMYRPRPAHAPPCVDWLPPLL